MEDLEHSVLESVLAVIINPFAGQTSDMGEEKVPISDLMDQLVDQHGYEDEQEPQFRQKVAEVLEKYKGECWRYTDTDNDGLPTDPLLVIFNQEENIHQALGQ